MSQATSPSASADVDVTSGWKHNLELWPCSVSELRIDARSTALIIVDMQNSYVRPDGNMVQLLNHKLPQLVPYFTERTKYAIPNQQKLLSFFRENNLKCIFITVGPELRDGSDQMERRRIRDQQRVKDGKSATPYKGSYQNQVIEELTPRDNELVLNKNSTSAFNSTMIDQFLRNMDIHSLVIVGCATSLCVETTARDAADKGYNVILAEDACINFDHEAHAATLRIFARGFGKVASVDEAVSFLSEGLKQKRAVTWP
jgi:nicotinamidase-related amidase